MASDLKKSKLGFDAASPEAREVLIKLLRSLKPVAVPLSMRP